MTEDTETALKVDGVPEVVECFMASEKGAFALSVSIARTMKCLDETVRAANASGVPIRSFDIANEQAMLAEAARSVSSAIGMLHGAHAKISALAEDLGIDIPQPKTGGR